MRVIVIKSSICSPGVCDCPCKIRTGILAGSRHDLGRNPAKIPARFQPPGFFFLAGIPSGSQQDSRQEAKFPASKISPGSCRKSRQDSCREAKIPAAKILPGSCHESCQDSHREAEIPAAKILARSCRKAHQDSRREAKIPAAKILPESYRESRQDSEKQIYGGENLSTISPRLEMGSEILGEIAEIPGKILDMFP